MNEIRHARTKLRVLGLLVLGCAAVSRAPAHHSAPTTYFLDQKIVIEGTVTQFLLRNPHSFIHVTALDDKGVMQEWAVEWGPGILLAHDHINTETLKAGDRVRITGSPGRIGAEHRLRISTLERLSDHWLWKGAFDCS